MTSLLSKVFSLEDDKLAADEIISSINKSSNFHGTNFFTLVCAIFIASIGLNVGSTAVIIGAMLISPLMGPIMGMGLSLGIYDLSLLYKSIRNFILMIFISLISSTIYFLLSPIKVETTEIIARTYPTMWDVAIAFFGGIAGIIGASRTEKSNVIPGVAIATALMPPLCTAGFGLANLKFDYFLGAIYLFLINTLFIAWSTYIIVNLLKLKPLDNLNLEKHNRVRRIITGIVIVMIIPSIILGYIFVTQIDFKKRVEDFILKEFNFARTFTLKNEVNPNTKEVKVFLFGDVLSEEQITQIKRKSLTYELDSSKLVILQGNQLYDENFRRKLSEDNLALSIQQKSVDSLANLSNDFINFFNLKKDVFSEIKVIFPDIIEIFLEPEENNLKTMQNVYIIFNSKNVPSKQYASINNWLKKRLKSDSLNISYSYLR